jgi:hypothetical protein
MRFTFIALLIKLLMPLNLSAQNLTGTWEGIGIGDYCKLVIYQIGDSLYGYTYDAGMGYCKCNFEGSYNDSTKKLTGKNTSFIERTQNHIMSTYRLRYSTDGVKEYLKGTTAPKTGIVKILSLGIGQPVTYVKVKNNIDTTTLIAKQIKQHTEDIVKLKPVNEAEVIADTIILPVPQAPKVISPDSILTVAKRNRQSTLVKTIETNTDSLRLVLYDNGEIDGDTVTVFSNGKIIINSLGLSVKPYEKKIAVPTDGSVLVIELLANNLGSIPPNTAYMQVWGKDKLHELRVSSDLNTNARIEIIYKRR